MAADVYRKKNCPDTNSWLGNDQGGVKNIRITVCHMDDGNSRLSCFGRDPETIRVPYDRKSCRSMHDYPVDKEHVD